MTSSTNLQAEGYLLLDVSSEPTINQTTNVTFPVIIVDVPPQMVTVVSMTLVYTLLLVTGTIGNFCTCFVIARNKYMHTATNYYLFSLAVSDLSLLILGLPHEVYLLWVDRPYGLGEFVCIFRGLTSETSTNASILTITSFTVERYLAICHPLRAHTMSKLSRCLRLIVAVWIVSGLCAIPIALQFGILIEEVNGHLVEDSAICTVLRPLSHAFEISTSVFFILPMSLISVLYVLIGLQLRRSEKIGRRNVTTPMNGLKRQPSTKNDNTFKKRQRQATASRRTVLKMLVAVVVTFFVCWAPFHAQRLMAIYASNPPTDREIEIYEVLNHISGVSYYVSATVNPILYSILSLKFRQAFKDTLARCCGRRVSRGGKLICLSTHQYRCSPRHLEHTEMTLVMAADSSPCLRLVVAGTAGTTPPTESGDLPVSCASSISNSSLHMVDKDAFELSVFVEKLRNGRG